LQRAEIPYLTEAGYLDFHSLRHGAITNASRSMNPFDLQKFARHSKIETTMKYVHANAEELTKAVAGMAPLPMPVIGSDQAGANTGQPVHQPVHDSDAGGHVRSLVVTGDSAVIPNSENDTTPAFGRGCH